MANIIAYNNFISEKHFICLVLIECRFVKRDANETSKYIIRAASIATKRTKVNADLADRTSEPRSVGSVFHQYHFNAF
jgi:hypothetical protein